jgi:uncharacterized small protein (DUF1192 family)
MKDRARAAERILGVQKQLHRIEELKYAQIQQKLSRAETDQVELTQALSQDDALHGLFVDVTVRRIAALRQEAARLGAELESQAKALLEHGGRLKNAERLKDDLAVEIRRADERKELERILEVALVKGDASLKQDR